tara:strand:- start:399 stop:533 length:135 start_codon:yes stop_codon:yes gene_type:complete
MFWNNLLDCKYLIMYGPIINETIKAVRAARIILNVKYLKTSNPE